MSLSFKAITKKDRPMIIEWLHLPHVAEWFHGQGLENTIDGLDRFINSDKSSSHYWLAYEKHTPFAFLITSIINYSEHLEPSSPHAKWVTPDRKMITLDILIGNTEFIGKGLAATLINTFLKDTFPENPIVFIDPESSNHRAIHVYEKAGFKKIDTFIASWHPVPHTLMIKET